MAEIFWYVTATLLAWVKTGLVGLSAATVMVPILIVLCPSFSGKTGAYPHVGDWRWRRRAGGSPVWKAPCGAAAGRPPGRWEGTGAMGLVSKVIGTAAMLVLTAMPWHQCMVFALAASVPGAYTELIT